jgi:hypothetical protein
MLGQTLEHEKCTAVHFAVVAVCRKELGLYYRPNAEEFGPRKRQQDLGFGKLGLRAVMHGCTSRTTGREDWGFQLQYNGI